MNKMNSHTRWQIVIFSVIFTGYAIYCLNRKSFTYLMSFIIEDTKLDKKDLGIITSSMTSAYAFSKFASSLVADSVSTRVLFSSGLVIVGLSSLQFSASDTISVFAVMYLLNGLGQGFGWPPCIKVLKQWFLPSQLGLLWSVLSTSGNVAGMVGPLVLPYLALHYGWRTSMWFAGVTSITFACIAFVSIKNTPSDVGLPPLYNEKLPEKEKLGKEKQESSKNNEMEKSKSSKHEKANKKKSMKAEDGKEVKDSIHDVLTSPFVWIIAFLCFVVKVVTFSCEDWVQLYLVQEKGFPVTLGGTFLSAHAIGAAFGTISSGYISDRLVAKHGILKRGSARYSLTTMLVLVDLISIHCFRSYVTRDTSLTILHLLAVLMGACQFSCFALYGVMIVEHSPTHLVGTSHGIAALFANLGGFVAGYPMTYLSKQYNWSAVFLCVEAANVVALITLLITRNVRSTIGKTHKQHEY